MAKNRKMRSAQAPVFEGLEARMLMSGGLMPALEAAAILASSIPASVVYDVQDIIPRAPTGFPSQGYAGYINYVNQGGPVENKAMVIAYFPDVYGNPIPIGGLMNYPEFPDWIPKNIISGFINGDNLSTPEREGLREGETLADINGGVFAIQDILGNGFGTIEGNNWMLGNDDIFSIHTSYFMDPYQGSGAGLFNVYITHPGDATLDNRVNVDDLGILASNYDTSGATWKMADFDGDGIVNVDDLGILATYYDWSAVPSGGMSVPEPATLSLIALGGVGLLGRRKRNSAR